MTKPPRYHDWEGRSLHALWTAYGEENYINVVHEDGTIAGYVHLTGSGALVQVGDEVSRGQVIGLSGDTGSSAAPHLHFHVRPCEGCGTIPVCFINTRPHPHGLVEGENYAAAPLPGSGTP